MFGLVCNYFTFTCNALRFFLVFEYLVTNFLLFKTMFNIGNLPTFSLMHEKDKVSLVCRSMMPTIDVPPTFS